MNQLYFCIFACLVIVLNKINPEYSGENHFTDNLFDFPAVILFN